MKQRSIRIVLTMLLVTMFLVSASPIPAFTQGEVSVSESLLVAPANNSAGSTLYLPIVAKNYPLVTLFGVEMDIYAPNLGLEQMTQSGASYFRYNGLIWSAVEPTKGARNWDAVSNLEGQLKGAGNVRGETILIIRSTPEWAQKVNGYTCGPVKQDEFGAFANFLRDAVARYSAPPFNVKYFELWNEPDIDPSLNVPDSVYGCWGEKDDTYYGGRYYGEMLKAVYPSIKAANPDSQVLLGGLLLDCNPDLAGSCNDKRPAMFLEGILRANAGPFFDGVSFHGYDYYQGSLGKFANANWKSGWNNGGPVVAHKASFIRSKLAAFNVTGKYLINTEAAVIFDGGCDEICQETKAFYMGQVYAAAIASELRANVWYSVTGWRNSGLINGSNMELMPAYNAYKLARSRLLASVFTREVSDYSQVKVYEFNRGDRRVWVLWSLDEATHVVELPGAPLAAWTWNTATKDYVAAAPSVSLEVGLAPIYLEWAP